MEERDEAGKIENDIGSEERVEESDRVDERNERNISYNSEQSAKPMPVVEKKDDEDLLKVRKEKFREKYLDSNSSKYINWKL